MRGAPKSVACAARSVLREVRRLGDVQRSLAVHLTRRPSTACTATALAVARATTCRSWPWPGNASKPASRSCP